MHICFKNATETSVLVWNALQRYNCCCRDDDGLQRYLHVSKNARANFQKDIVCLRQPHIQKSRLLQVIWTLTWNSTWAVTNDVSQERKNTNADKNTHGESPTVCLRPALPRCGFQFMLAHLWTLHLPHFYHCSLQVNVLLDALC